MPKICILGSGSWGTAQALLLSSKELQVILWGRIEDGVDSLQQERENRRFLPGIRLSDTIVATSDLAQALKGADMVVMAVPSQSLREVLEKARPYLGKDSCLVNTAKGLEISSGMRMSQVVEDVLGSQSRERYAVLSGPSHAEEVARNIPTAITVASYRKENAFLVQDLYMTPFFRVYTNPDVAGVELGGALKNIIALGTGIATGLGYGDNTQAALLTRGLHEIIRMGEAMGGEARTFSGLSGIGDLVVTCSSRHSRNRQAGILIGQGYSLEETLKQIAMVVEGAHTIRVVHRLACQLRIDMPICTACYNVLYANRKARDEVDDLMRRQKKHEIEEIVKRKKGW